MSRLIPPVEKPVEVPDGIKVNFLCSTQADDLIGATAARAKFAVDGSGLCVAVLDTGLRATHEDFVGRVVAGVNYTKDNGADPKDVSDGNGHGTHVAGIIVAQGGGQEGMPRVGIAPGAGVIPIKVLTNDDGGDFSDVERGLEWVLKHQAEFNISVVCLSLSDEQNHVEHEGHGLEEIDRLIGKLRDVQVATVVAAGNDYFLHGSQEGMGFPAIVAKSISVGAVYDARFGYASYRGGAEAFETDVDRLTPFSQRLHASTNPTAFTTIFAPGAPITSSGIGSDVASSTQSGTSQAAPVVCGVILLVQQLHQKIVGGLPSVDSLIEWMRLGATKIIDGDDELDNVEHTGKEFLRIDAGKTLGAVARAVNRQLAFEGIGSVADLK